MKPHACDPVLIVGGCGYIGSALYLHLLSRGFHVDTVDLEMFGNSVNPTNLRSDVTSLTIEDLNRYPAIIMLGGRASVSMCTDGALAFRDNVATFIALLEKIADAKVIYASSASIYGLRGADRCREEDFIAPKCLNYYDWSKRVIEQYANLHHPNAFGLRLGTVCGYSHNLRVDLMLNKMYHGATISRCVKS